jgi:hypothetical protein
MVAAIQTFGELLHWHPHVHALVTCGAFTPDGEFLELPELDMDRLQTAWQEAVFAPTRSTGCPAGRRQDRAGSGREHAHLAAPGFSVIGQCTCRPVTGGRQRLGTA